MYSTVPGLCLHNCQWVQVADVGLSKMISNSVGTKASGIGTLDWVSLSDD